MTTIVRGQFLKPDGSPIAGIQIQAYLDTISAESAGPEIYIANASVTTTSDSTGKWSLTLWSNENSVTDSKYTFIFIQSSGAAPIKHTLKVPNVTEVLFSDLLANYSSELRSNDLYNTDAAIHDLKFIQGNTVRRSFNIADPSNQPMDLTGWDAVMYIIDNKDKTWFREVQLTTEPLNGELKLLLTSNTTWEFAGRELQYEVFLYNTNDTIKILQGAITVKPSLMRPNSV